MYSRKMPYPPSSTISQVTSAWCCAAVANSEIEYMAPPSPDTARVRVCVPIAAPIAAGYANPRPPAPCAEWKAPSSGSHADQAQYPAMVMSQKVWVSG